MFFFLFLYSSRGMGGAIKHKSYNDGERKLNRCLGLLSIE
ncbi:hypothetical protein HMPREF1982_01851 [Clostridiales bacterium oral taxon 876 str. F0540]|nr:hypothetical protein HMPREF1982_01851 [Clostridiales bacterium oral taxon 876 str. F0540]